MQRPVSRMRCVRQPIRSFREPKRDIFLALTPRAALDVSTSTDPSGSGESSFGRGGHLAHFGRRVAKGQAPASCCEMRARPARPSACASAAAGKKGVVAETPRRKSKTTNTDVTQVCLSFNAWKHSIGLRCTVLPGGGCQQVRCHRMAAADAGIGHLCLAKSPSRKSSVRPFACRYPEIKRKAKI